MSSLLDTCSISSGGKTCDKSQRRAKQITVPLTATRGAETAGSSSYHFLCRGHWLGQPQGTPRLEPGVTAVGKREDCGAGTLPTDEWGHQGLEPGYGAGVEARPAWGGGQPDQCTWLPGVAGSSGEPWQRLRASPGLTFFMLPRVTVERALDISRGLRPRNSPIFPSTCTMYLAERKQGRQCHASADTHSEVTVTEGRSAQEPGSDQAPPILL